MHQPDAQRTLCLSAQQAERFAQLLLRLHDAARRLRVQFARRGEPNGGMAAHEYAFAQLCLDLAHGLRQRRLGDLKRFGGGGEAALAQDGQDDSGMAGIHGGASRWCDLILL